MSDKTATVIVAVVIFTLLAVIAVFVPRTVTSNRLTYAAKHAKHLDVHDGTCFEELVDWWKNPICIVRSVARDGMTVSYVAYSSGRDGKKGTLDDQSEGVLDLNKTKLIGSWVGERVKQVGSGFLHGLKKESKFKEETE